MTFSAQACRSALRATIACGHPDCQGCHLYYQGLPWQKGKQFRRGEFDRLFSLRVEASDDQVQRSARVILSFGIELIGIFGSVARGTATDDSDVDIVSYRPRMNLYLKERIDREACYV